MISGWFLQPVYDYLAALEYCLVQRPFRAVFQMISGFILGWIIYVPLHELMHAFGCMAAGGTVSRLEIDAIYGAALLQHIFPWVAVGSDYAGQLTGFDTHGSDAIYLVTDFAPFLLTLFVGAPALRRLPRLSLPAPWRCLLFGTLLPVAFAPFVSLPGDYYEMGSILVSACMAAISPGFDVTRWRSDDLILQVRTLMGPEGSGSIGDSIGITAGFALGAVMAWGTYLLGARLGGRAERPGSASAVAR